MKKLVPLLALIAAPAAAQDGQVYYASSHWPVELAGPVCTMSSQLTGEDSSPLTIAYDTRSGEITLTARTQAITARGESGNIDVALVFLGNGAAHRDDGWGARRFTYVRDGDALNLTTRFAGRNNLRQILADLDNSDFLGLVYGNAPVTSTALSGAGASLAKLQECAQQAMAAN